MSKAKKSAKITPDGLCRCGSGRPYPACCQPWHNGRPAPTPEALLRSRYAAYALGKAAYIMRTTHPDSPHWQRETAVWQRDILAFCRQTDFIGLQILVVGEDWVTFRAILRQGEQDASFTERSRFARHQGMWKYVAGD